MSRVWTCVLAAALAPLAVGHAQTGASAPAIADLLVRVGAAVERYYERAESIVWREEITFQSLGHDLMPDLGLYRRLAYDLRVVWRSPDDGGVPEPKVQRDLLEVNGRSPRPNDKPRCGDPPPTLPESLEFLLPANQADTVFKVAGRGETDGRPAVRLDYRSRESGPGTLTVHEDDEDCVSLEVPGSVQGRLWIDPGTADVLRMDEHLVGPVDMRWVRGTRNQWNRGPVVLERLDTTVIYRPVSFTDPDERVMLPASVESMRVMRNLGYGRLRTRQKFSSYRRFTTDGRIVGLD
jgi:hypothetical protein